MNPHDRFWDSPYPSRITPTRVKRWVKQYPTPFYVYDRETLIRRIQEVKDFPRPAFSSFTPRYAIKANPTRALIEILDSSGIAFDASSAYEVERLLKIGIAPEKILFTSQEIPAHQERFRTLFQKGLLYNATSLRQLEWYGRLCSGKNISSRNISVRINPGFGSGMHTKTTVGGADSGFGIWSEDYSQIITLCRKYRLNVERIHTHVGSGSDPKTWVAVADSTLALLKHFPTARILNLGGGFKVGRHPDESCANLKEIGTKISERLEAYSKKHHRVFDLEIEPGTYYVSEAGLLIAQVEDVITTRVNMKGKKGAGDSISFIKLNMGMNDLIRPTLYHARHHIDIIPRLPRNSPTSVKRPYIVIGHCCESGDQLSQHPHLPNGEMEKKGKAKATLSFPPPQSGDPVIIHGVGAYGSAMSSRYNSFPLIAEYLFDSSTHKQGRKSSPQLIPIRKRETLEEAMAQEISLVNPTRIHKIKRNPSI